MTTNSDTPAKATWPTNALINVLGIAGQSNGRAVAVLVVVCLLAFLPGFFQIAPVDRDEARFAQAAKQMIENSEYFDIRFQDGFRFKKPIGIYWLQVGVVKGAAALGIPQAQTTIWLYRIPSLLGGIGAVLLTYWTALAFVPRRAAVVAGLMMASSILLGVEARLAKTDAVLLMMVIASMGALAYSYLPEHRDKRTALAGWLLPFVFWTALAIGVLVKGPLILMFAGLAIVALAVVDRSVRWLAAMRPGLGILWFALLVLPWFVFIASRSGGNFFIESMGRDLLSKVVIGQESHGAPPGTYFALFWATFWPGATLAGLAAPAVWAARREPGARFLLAWLLPSWLVLELVVTKLPHYVLPLYPAVAILIAGVLHAGMLSKNRLMVRGTIWWFIVPVAVGLAGVVGLIAYERDLGLLAWPFVGGAAVYGLVAWWLYADDGAEHALLRAVASSVLLAIAVYGVIIPSLTRMFPSVTMAQVLRDSGCADPLVASAGYNEASLMFLAGTPTRFTNGSRAAEFLKEGPCRFALIEKRQERGFVRRAESIGLRYSRADTIEAINYTNGRQLSMIVYRSGIPD